MRFEKIVLSNYRQYKHMELKFPKIEESDLHIVIASNGIGKTNLLNAIEWCLYETESHLDDDSDKLSICNLDVIDTALSNREEEAIVSVKIFASTGYENIVFERSVKVNTSSKIPDMTEFQVTIQPELGNSEIYSGDACKDIVNSYLPKKIKEYFFFDGEQLYNYFGKTQSKNVKDSIYEISQINLISSTKKHLNEIIQEKQRKIAKLNPESERLQLELDDFKKQLDNCNFEVERMKEENENAEERIDELTKKIAGLEYIAEEDERYRKIKKDIEKLESKKTELDDKLVSFIHKYYTLFSFYDINKRTSSYILDKEAKGNLPPDINKDLLDESIKQRKCAICEQSIDGNILKHFQDLIEKFSVSSAVSNKLMEIKNETVTACNNVLNYEKDKEELYKLRRENDDEILKLTQEADKLYKTISNCSSKEDIAEWISERKKLKELYDINQDKIIAYSTKSNSLQKNIILKEKQIEEAINGEQIAEQINNELNLLKEALSIVSDTEFEVTSEIRKCMEKETFKIFSDLIWKNNTYGNISLNNDYKLKLYHINGDSCLGSCSAAERELLALAFTLALHKVSHHDSLLFIDTPVGRVSDENRECFAKSLISISSSKQLILAFTPSEYSIEIKKYFDSYAASINDFRTNNELETIRI